MNKIFTVLVYSSAHVTTVISYETMVLKFDVPGHCGLVRVTSCTVDRLAGAKRLRYIDW